MKSKQFPNKPTRLRHSTRTSAIGAMAMLCATVWATPQNHKQSSDNPQTANGGVQPLAQSGQRQTGQNTPQEAQNAPQPVPLITEGVTFAPAAAFDKGQALRYATQQSMTLRIPGQNGGVSSFTASISMGLTLRYKVRDTKPDGTAQVGVTSEGGRMLDASSAFHDIPKEADNAARLLTLDRQSHITAFKDQTAKSKNGGLDALFTQSNLLVPLHILPLPDKPVHVGESWTARYASPGKNLGVADANTEGNGENDDVRATLTLLGIEKIGDVNTIKIKQVLTVPYIAYTDAQGKPVGAKGAQGRMTMQLTFTQLINALPQTGLLVRSEGAIAGTIKFEGALLKQLPGDTMTIGGKLIAIRADDNAPDPAAK